MGIDPGEPFVLGEVQVSLYAFNCGRISAGKLAADNELTLITLAITKAGEAEKCFFEVITQNYSTSSTVVSPKAGRAQVASRFRICNLQANEFLPAFEATRNRFAGFWGCDCFAY